MRRRSLGASVKNDALDVGDFEYAGGCGFLSRRYQRARSSFINRRWVLAGRGKDPGVVLLSKLNVARMAMEQGRSKEALTMLRPLLNTGGSTNAYLSVQCAVAYAEAEVDAKDYAHAARDLEQVLTRTEKAGMRLDSARIYYLRGTVARLTGDADRSRTSYYYGEAVRLLDAIRADPGAENVLKRVDLKAMYEDAGRWK